MAARRSCFALLVIGLWGSAAPAADQDEWNHPGLLRGRDLTPVGRR